MKRFTSLLMTAVFIFIMSACKAETSVTENGNLPVQTTITPEGAVSPENKRVRLSVCEAIGNSGFAKKLTRAFEEDTDYILEVSSNSNSTAVSVAEAGKADLLWILSSTASKQFISAGYGVSGEDVISDCCVLAGPSSDPANVRSCRTLAEAFALISEEGAAGFVSRGDESDLCMTEKSILAREGFVVGSGNSWYYNAKTGMASSLMTANERGAYILTDKETFLMLEEELDIEILTECKDTKNVYTLIDVSGEMFESVNREGAEAFKEWLRSERAVKLIEEYGMSEYGSKIFRCE